MSGILFIGCGRTATAIAGGLATIPDLGTFYLNSRTGRGAHELEKVLKEKGKSDVKVISRPLDVDSPRYIIIALTNMPDEMWRANVQMVRTTAENRLTEVIYNFPPMVGLKATFDKFRSDSTTLVVTNPVDYFTNHLRSSFCLDNIFGFGLELDAERYKHFLFSNPDAPRPLCVGIHGEAFPFTGWGKDILYGDLYHRADEELLEFVKANGMPYDFCGNQFVDFFKRFTGDKESIAQLSVPLVSYHGLDGVCMSVPVRVQNGKVLGYVPVELNNVERTRLHSIRDRLCVVLGGMNKIQDAYQKLSGH